MPTIFKTSDYSKFKTKPQRPFDEEEKKLGRDLEFVAEKIFSENHELDFGIGTKYHDATRETRELYGWDMVEVAGKTYEVQIWPRPQIEAERIDN